MNENIEWCLKHDKEFAESWKEYSIDMRKQWFNNEWYDVPNPISRMSKSVKIARKILETGKLKKVCNKYQEGVISE